MVNSIRLHKNVFLGKPPSFVNVGGGVKNLKAVVDETVTERSYDAVNKDISKGLKLRPTLLNPFPESETLVHTKTWLFMAFNAEFSLCRPGKDDITLTQAGMF